MYICIYIYIYIYIYTYIHTYIISAFWVVWPPLHVSHCSSLREEVGASADLSSAELVKPIVGFSYSVY